MWKRLRLDQQIFILALGAGIPGAVTALWILWTEAYTPKVQWTLSVLILTTLSESSPVRDGTNFVFCSA